MNVAVKVATVVVLVAAAAAVANCAVDELLLLRAHARIPLLFYSLVQTRLGATSSGPIVVARLFAGAFLRLGRGQKQNDVKFAGPLCFDHVTNPSLHHRLLCRKSVSPSLTSSKEREHKKGLFLARPLLRQ